MNLPKPSEADVKLYQTDPVLHAAVQNLVYDICRSREIAISNRPYVEELINISIIHLASYNSVIAEQNRVLLAENARLISEKTFTENRINRAIRL